MVPPHLSAGTKGGAGEPRGDAVMLAVVGPTGTGKTALALEIAQRANAEIVNLDSRQVYRGLDIGSAKPTPDERARVRHHLFDVVAPDDPFDCARYRELACAAVADIRRRGRRVLLVGGTGLYLKVLRYGLFPGPQRDARVRARLLEQEKGRRGSLHARLGEVDPDRAARLHPHDVVRLVRALEVYELTGRPLSRWQAEHGFRQMQFDIRVAGLDFDRRALYARLDGRCAAMIDAGLVDEVRSLRECGYSSELAPLRSIGYREIGAFLDGECDLDTALRDMARATRRLAKRQLTWFRRVPGLRWYDALSANAGEILQEVPW